MRISRSLFVVTWSVVLLAESVHAQRTNQEILNWTVAVHDAELLGDPARSYRAYTEREQLKILLTVSNGSEASALIDQTRIQSAFDVRVSAMDAIPINIEWPEVWPPESVTSISTAARQSFLLEAHQGVRWAITLQRQDGQPFVSGRYRIDTAMRSLEAAAQSLNGIRWTERGPTTMDLALFVVAPTTPRERASMYRVRARDAVARRAFAEALQDYADALAADPTDVQAQLGLATIYVTLRRYREAIPHFEAVLPTLPPGPNWVVMSLAQAYAGVGNEGNAVRVLRASGMTEDAVTSELARLRQLVSR
jgi:tetratricopeptide (TPR) repeat protein